VCRKIAIVAPEFGTFQTIEAADRPTKHVGCNEKRLVREEQSRRIELLTSTEARNRAPRGQISGIRLLTDNSQLATASIIIPAWTCRIYWEATALTRSCATDMNRTLGYILLCALLIVICAWKLMNPDAEVRRLAKDRKAWGYESDERMLNKMKSGVIGLYSFVLIGSVVMLVRFIYQYVSAD
jgi:hypothetical protein